MVLVPLLMSSLLITEDIVNYITIDLYSDKISFRTYLNEKVQMYLARTVQPRKFCSQNRRKLSLSTDCYFFSVKNSTFLNRFDKNSNLSNFFRSSVTVIGQSRLIPPPHQKRGPPYQSKFEGPVRCLPPKMLPV